MWHVMHGVSESMKLDHCLKFKPHIETLIILIIVWCSKPHVKASSIIIVWCSKPHLEASSFIIGLCSKPYVEASSFTIVLCSKPHVEASSFIIMWCAKPHVEASSFLIVLCWKPHVEASSFIIVWCSKPHVEASSFTLCDVRSLMLRLRASLLFNLQSLVMSFPTLHKNLAWNLIVSKQQKRIEFDSFEEIYFWNFWQEIAFFKNWAIY